MHSWASWAQKNMYLEQACQEGSLTHSPHKKKIIKKKIFVFSIYFAFLESSAEEELSVHTAQQLPSGHSLCLVGVARISHFWGSNEPQISLLCCSKCLRFHMASWGSYRKQRDIPDFSTGLSQRCFWTKVCAIELRFTELSTPFSHCRQFQGFLQDRKID